MSEQGEPGMERGTNARKGPYLDARVGSAGGPGAGGSTFTVLVAAAANFGVALAKAVAGVLSGSSAMLAEAGHSVADTITEALLFVALKRSKKPADDDHPLGYGPERYIWALLASVATFVGGGVFAVYDGIHALTHDEKPGNPLISYIVLAVAFVLEGLSLRTGWRQATGRAEHFRVPILRYLQHTPDTAVKAVVMEDSAALVGLVLAALGLLGGQLTGSGVFDGIASILIGVLLVVVAYILGRANTELLVGRALPKPMREAVLRELRSVEAVQDVMELTTLVQGPGEILIAAKVDFRDVSTSAQIEWACEEAETRLRTLIPAVKRVYLDPTPPRSAPPRLPE
ncbi:cation diffusion facilitator family transporter [Streptomyces sp. NPDC085596]|uniref:cation diffusion facilitator family transporter n=1 Tax=Streptomyces sp. NPDC085596 TaxID=3365731 RepID=UPI0037D123A5